MLSFFINQIYGWSISSQFMMDNELIFIRVTNQDIKFTPLLLLLLLFLRVSQSVDDD